MTSVKSVPGKGKADQKGQRIDLFADMGGDPLSAMMAGLEEKPDEEDASGANSSEEDSSASGSSGSGSSGSGSYGGTSDEDNEVASHTVTLLTGISHGNELDVTPGIEPEVLEMLRAIHRQEWVSRLDKAIDAMQADGLLSPEQAKSLKSEIASGVPLEMVGKGLSNDVQLQVRQSLEKACQDIQTEQQKATDENQDKTQDNEEEKGARQAGARAKGGKDDAEQKPSLVMEYLAGIGLIAPDTFSRSAASQEGVNVSPMGQQHDAYAAANEKVALIAMTETVETSAKAFDRALAEEKAKETTIAQEPLAASSKAPSIEAAPDAPPSRSGNQFDGLRDLIFNGGGGVKLSCLDLGDTGAALAVGAHQGGNASPTVVTEAVLKDRAAASHPLPDKSSGN